MNQSELQELFEYIIYLELANKRLEAERDRAVTLAHQLRGERNMALHIAQSRSLH